MDEKQPEPPVKLSAKHNLRTAAASAKNKTLEKSRALKQKLFSRKQQPEPEKPPIVLELPPYETEDEILSRYWLTPPHAHAVVTRDAHNALCYHVIEPKIAEKEYLVLEETFEHLRSTLVFGTDKKPNAERLDRETLISAIRTRA